jgi:hypothetical protein
MSESQYPLTGVKRIIRPDGTVEKIEFRDAPQTPDETTAFEKYAHLSPLGVLRLLRAAEWNLAVARDGRDIWKESSQRLERKLQRAAQKLAAVTPDGWEVPAAVASLVKHAKENGWRTALAWAPDGDFMLLSVAIGRAVTEADGLSRGTRWKYDLRWSCSQGSASRTRAGLAQTPEHPQWHDAPSLKKIREVIAEHPAPSA